jgi:hypothetical protein
MSEAERIAHSLKWGTDYAASRGVTAAADIASGVQAITPSDAYTRQFGDDAVRGTGLRGEPTVSYKFNEVQQAAQDIQSLGLPLQQGNKFYDTGNRQVNEALYGNDIALNLSSDGQAGYRTPKQYDVRFADYLGSAVKQGVQSAATSALTGGLFSSLSGLAGAAPVAQAAEAGSTAAKVGQVVDALGTGYQVANLAQNTYDDARDRPSDRPSIVGSVFGNEYGVDWDRVINPREATGPGGLYDRVIVDQVTRPDLQPNEGGGGGSSSGSTDGAGGVQLPRQNPEELGTGEEEDVWIYNGTGELVNVYTDERRAVPNPDRLVVGATYNGDAEPIGEPTEEEERGFTLGGVTMDEAMADLSIPSVASDSWRPSVTITQGDRPTPTVNLPGEGQVVDRGDLLQRDDLTTGGTGGGTGSGSGTGSGGGSGSGSGDGTGDGDGDGDVNNSGMQVAGNQAGGGGGGSDLFPYTRITPAQAAKLSGMMDYVAALRRR